MSAFYSKIVEKTHRFIATVIFISILATLIPVSVFAEDVVPVDGVPQTQQTSTSTDETSLQNGATASSTENGTGGGDGTDQDGLDGQGGTQNGNSATTTTATSTPNQGSDGPNGNEGTAGATPDDEVTPIDIISDGLLGDIDAPEKEETTGDIRRTGTHALIETGIATAQGELSTDANSNDVRSELGTNRPNDYDTYTFIATGTNKAVVTNDGLTRSTSGDNYARGRSTAKIKTGNSISAFNIANVINTNVINSDGFIYLANKILDEGQSLDLTSAFFPDPQSERALSNTCSLLSCIAEDVVYNVSQMNHATITNNALIESVTGYNGTLGDLSAEVTSGDAYAAANVINVVNSNIIDSNYRLFTYNAIGDLDGDLVLPTGELFDAFFGRANGIAVSENDRRGKYEDFNVNANNANEATADNNIETYAETGLNKSKTLFNSGITTGRAESESNVLNKINENTYGGDSMYMLIRVHGVWSGDVVGLPEGLAWEWTPQGIVIYNEDAEITPSQFLSSYDLDSYTANFDNNNRVALENNITINSITGENEVEGRLGTIKTGNAFASANVMNIANTNIIGTNWTFAVINILGDFDGNVSFATTDVALTGSLSTVNNPLRLNDTLTYTYTITNHSNSTATNLVLDQTLQSAKTLSNQTAQSVSVGTLAPGASKQVVLKAKVNPDLAYGTTSVVAYASVSGDQGDSNITDNLLMLSRNAVNPGPVVIGGGTGTTTSTSTDDTTDPTDDDTSTTTPPTGEENNETPVITPPNNTPSATGGGGGGGGPSTKKTKVDREEVKAIDPNKAPLLTIKKVAVNVDEDEVVNAGQSVDYKITVTNAGGNAYDVEVFDVLTNPIGSIVNEQSWVLDTVLPGEVINLTYTTEYNPSTPSGKYTNTASVQAYLKDGMKEKKEAPLKVKDAVYTVEVKGLDLAIGNVAVLAYFPGANGKTSALVAWETSKPSLSQVFYGPTTAVSPYNPKATNFGYTNASFKFPTAKPKHAMIINNLEPGRTHSYRIHAQSDTFLATSREYTLTVPASVLKLTLAFPTNPTSMVAGVTASTPTPATVVPVQKYVPPPAPKPASVPAPVPQTTSQAPAPAGQNQGGVFGFVKNAFGFFR